MERVAPVWDEQFRTRLRWWTALVGAVTFFVPFALFLAVVNSASERHVREEVYSRLQSGVAANAELFEDVLAARRAEVQGMAQSLSRAPAQEQWPEILSGFVARSPWYGAAYVADSRGEILAASGHGLGNVGDWPSFRHAREGRTEVSGVFFSPLTHKPEMVVATPLGERTSGGGLVLLAALRLEKWGSRLLRWGPEAGGTTLLVTDKGQLASPAGIGLAVLGATVFDPQGPNPFQGQTGVCEYRDFGGRLALCAYRRLDTLNYHLVAQVQRSEMDASIRALRWTILAYVAPFLALGVVLAFFAWHYVLNYIERLTGQLYQALCVAQQRERERDLAHKELARRFQEERELAQQKAQFQAQLAEYEKYAAMAQLAVGAAHEINNPLLGILSHLELEQRSSAGEEERQEIEQCIAGAKRIAATVRGLLNYARPGPLRLSRLNLQTLINDTLAFLCHQPLFRKIKIETKMAPDLPAITADPNQLSQILMNLLLNGAEAMPEGGRLTIAAEKVKFEEQVEICVSDTGPGIPSDVLPHIFEPFYTTKRGKGTGLGLSITQAYVHSHGGEIQVDSIPQRGTTVRLTLPIRQAQRAVPEVEEVIT